MTASPLTASLLVLEFVIPLRGDLTMASFSHGGDRELAGTPSFSQLKLTTT